MLKHFVPRGVPETPLGRYLSRAYPMIPGFAVREALKKRDVRVNGRKTDSGSVVSGDEVTLYIPDKYLPAPADVIYRADGLLVIDKPAGLPVDRDRDGVGEDTALSRARLLDPGARLCHRLDSGTGGVLILATDDAAYQKTVEAFKTHSLRKVYECVVKGVMEPESGKLTHYIKKDAENSRVAVSDHAMAGYEKAVMYYKTVEASGEASLVEAELVTGRTHQIRAQFSHIKHPLLGDDKYGDRDFNKSRNAVMPALWCLEISLDGHTFKSRGGVKCT